MDRLIEMANADTDFFRQLLNDPHGMKALPHRNTGRTFTNMIRLAESVPGVRVGTASSMASMAQFVYLDDRAAVESWIAEREALVAEFAA